jgi:hypothetical protein
VCVRLALGLSILGVAGLVDPWFALPLAALLLAFAALTWVAALDVFDDPPDPTEVVEEVTPATVERTFRLPTSVGAERVHLVGDFNDWSRTAHPMPRDGDWFTIVIELEQGRAYRYRYLLDGVRWENDWDAEAYVPNPHGTDDSVVST